MEIIVDINEKHKFVTSAKNNNQTFVRVVPKQGYWQKDLPEQDLYLDVEDMRGYKGVYLVPFNGYIDNNWEHRIFSTKVGKDALLNGFDIYKDTVENISKEEAIKRLQNTY
jgi:hypothetical protein